MSRDLLRRVEQLEAARPAVAEPLPRGAGLARLVGLELDPWQRDVLESGASQLALNCSRQSGKTETAVVLGVETAVHEAGSLVLILAPTQRQASESFRRLKRLLGALGSQAPVIVQESTLSLELANRSRVVALPGKDASIRGYANVALLVVDEAARVPDDLYMAVRPMLAVSRGRIVMLSTPWGRRGFFHQMMTADTGDWHRVTITAEECPRIDTAWLAAERERIGQYWYRQEYRCEFVDTEVQVFASDVIAAAVDATIRPLFGPTVTPEAVA